MTTHLVRVDDHTAHHGLLQVTPEGMLGVQHDEKADQIDLIIAATQCVCINLQPTGRGKKGTDSKKEVRVSGF